MAEERETERARARPFRSATVRGRVFASGAVVGLAIAIAAGAVLSPLLAARTDLRRIAKNDLPVQSQLVAFRTAVVSWQLFIDRHLATVTPGVATDPADVVTAGQLVRTQTTEAQALSRGLRRVGFDTDARRLDAAMTVFNTAFRTLTPIASGTPIAAATVQKLVNGERTAVESVWTMTTQIAEHLPQALTVSDARRATDHLALGVWCFAIAAAIAVLSVFAAAIAFGRRAGRRERDQQRLSRRHAYETRVQEALEMTKTEPDVYAILGEALHESVPHLKVEMLIAEASRAHFHRVLTNGDGFDGCRVASPLDCPAATAGHALEFPSSRAINACPYLRGRESGECSAVCVPLSVAGSAIGITHVVGPDGVLPAVDDIETLDFTSGRGSERIAMIRAFATSETQAQTDPLTTLLNRRSLDRAVRQLRLDGVPYALAYGDLDHFKALNDTHGHDAGDQALRLFARVLNESLRPIDIAARYGGEEFVIILPECDTDVATGVLERVRESLALALAGERLPSFTVTFGVASTAYAGDFAQIVAIADRALLAAKAAGRNRVVVAELPMQDQHDVDAETPRPAQARLAAT